MNRILMSVTLVAALCMGGMAQAAELSQGQVISKKVGNVVVHDYVSKTGGAAQIVETDRLVVFDVPGNAPQNADFKTFADSLGKPVEAVVISHGHEHHWLGVDTLFPGVKVYSTQASAINGEAGMKALEKARSTMGKEMIPYTSVPAVESLADGKKNLGGVEYEFTTLPELGASIIALPAEKVVMTHHLGYVGVHVPMPPFDARLAELNERYNEDRYDPKDGQLVKACDSLAAFIEAYSSIHNGIGSPHLYEAVARMRKTCSSIRLGSFSLAPLLADFD